MRTMKHERLCTICKGGQVEDEQHFLLKCAIYDSLKAKYKFEHYNEAPAFFTEEDVSTLGKYLIEAFEIREKIIKVNNGIEGEGEGEGVTQATPTGLDKCSLFSVLLNFALMFSLSFI